jgi:hypothetical protein
VPSIESPSFKFHRNAVLSDKQGRCLELGPGDCFGSLCLTGRASEETVSTISELQCLSLTVDHFINGPLSKGMASRECSSKPDDESQQSLMTRHLPASRFPRYPQHDESDCGLAALALIGEFHDVPARDLIYQTAPALPDCGLSLLQLRDLARSISLSAEAYRIDPEHLCDVVCPFIAHLNDGHFIVVFHTDDHSALIADPASSLHSITDEKLKEIWSRHLILISLAKLTKDSPRS